MTYSTFFAFPRKQFTRPSRVQLSRVINWSGKGGTIFRSVGQELDCGWKRRIKVEIAHSSSLIPISGSKDSWN